MKYLIISVIAVLTSFPAFSQIQMGRITAHQMVDKEVKSGDLVLYYPGDRFPRAKDNLWLTLELAEKRSAFIEITSVGRNKLDEILNAYLEMENTVKTPEKLPSSIPVGDMVVRAAFTDESGKYHMDDYQTISFFVKFDKQGNKSLGMSVGLMESKSMPDVKHQVPLLWFDHNMVRDFRSEVSEESFQQFLRNKDKTLNPEALKILGE